MSHLREFFCLGSPLTREPSVYGNPQWYELYESADAEGIDFEHRQCPLDSRHSRAGNRVGDLSLILPTPHVGDFIWTWLSDLVVTDRVLNLFNEAGFSGFEARKASILRIRGRRRSDSTPAPKVWELQVLGKGGDAHPNAGIRLLYTCSGCGLTRYSSFRNGIILDEKQWDGSDFFTVNGYSKFILITESVKNLIIQNNLSNCSILRSQDLEWGDSPRPEDNPEFYIPSRVVGSPERLIRECKEILSGMSGPTGLFVEAREYLNLFASLGELSYGVWAFDLPENEIREVAASSKEIKNRLSGLLGGRRHLILPGLEAGVDKAIDEASKWCAKTMDALVARGKESSFEPFEFFVLRTRDRLGYALRVLKDLGGTPSPLVSKRMEELDGNLRETVPKLIEVFKRKAEARTFQPQRFPEFFWWRRPVR